jgi:hypothetical protein
MHIGESEPNKRIIKWGVWLLRKKLGEQANAKAIHDDMINCGNLGIRYIANLNMETAEFVKCDHQKIIQLELVELFLWFVYKDTAWRDQFFYILDEMLKDADELRALIKPYVKPPHQWHVNVWTDSRGMTAKDVADGKIPQGTVSMAESVHVKTIQQQRLSEIATRSARNQRK